MILFSKLPNWPKKWICSNDLANNVPWNLHNRFHAVIHFSSIKCFNAFWIISINGLNLRLDGNLRM